MKCGTVVLPPAGAPSGLPSGAAPTTPGGGIDVLGQRVGLAGTAVVDASGTAGAPAPTNEG